MKTFIVFLFIFSVVVGIHEFGHFILAKQSGIQVREFAIGMGPKIFQHQATDGTTYTLRILPLGGYVRMAGLMDEEEIEPGMVAGLSFKDDTIVKINLSEQIGPDEFIVRIDDADLVHEMTLAGVPNGQQEVITYQVSKEAVVIDREGTPLQVAPFENRYEAASWWSKLKTNFAGPMSNFLLGIVVFTIVGFMLPGIPQNSPLPIIGQVVENSPADQAGMQVDDQIIQIDQQPVNDWLQAVELISQYPDKQVSMVVQRDDETVVLEITPESYLDEQSDQPVGKIGVVKGDIYDDSLMAKLTFGFKETWYVIASLVHFLLGIFTGGFSTNDLGGPVAMIEMTSQVSQFGMVAILNFMAYISINLGIFNLLPIPALDGGKIVLNLIEAVRGKPISQEKEGYLTLIGALLLIILMLLVTWNDIMRVFFK